MKTRKIMSLLLAFALTVTSAINSFAVKPNSDSNSETDDSFSDIVVPELLVSEDDLEKQMADIDRRVQEVKQLQKKLFEIDSKFPELKNIEEILQKEPDKLSESLRKTIGEREEAKRELIAAREELKKLIKNNTLRHRFYEGAAVGATGTTILIATAVGIGACIRAIHARLSNN